MIDAADGAVRDWEYERERRALVSSKKRFLEYHNRNAVTFYSTYNIPPNASNYYLLHNYGVVGFGHYYSDMPDKPVYMRGSLVSLSAKYGPDGWSGHRCGWEERVIMRYLRVTRFTSIDYNEIEKKIQELIRHRCGFPHYKTWEAMRRNLGLDDYKGHFNKMLCYINGRQYDVPNVATFKAIKRQHKLLMKFGAL